MLTDILKSTILLCFISYISNGGIREYMHKFVQHYLDFFLSNIYFSQLLHLLNNGDEDWLELDLNNKIEDKIEDKTLEKKEIKYEDKYLDEIRKMNKEYIFDDEENEKINSKYNELYNLCINNYKNKSEELLDKIIKINKRLASYEDNSDYDDLGLEEEEEDDDEYELGDTIEEKMANLMKENKNLISEYDKIKQIIETDEGKNQIMENTKKQAIDFIINERLDKLKNSFIIEKTPQGNVLMFWNNSRDVFQYYSDNTIPYRYLEPVGRKYVKTFNCRPIFIDMEEELKISEEKAKKQKEERERIELEEKERLDKEKKDNISISQKKNDVFAKFKTYNKEAGSGHVNKVAPPKNSIPHKSVTDEDSNKIILLKDRTNRYTYEGKFSNFNFLKKVDRKVVDKKFAISFADFKKNILMKK